ncbi:TPA: restriction endonuclease subunit S [Escherichia coli]|nr:restriction endonuclease subunit S [Escherichia coli]EEQ3310541.1 restriction endonuclease subunit S [Escherichia coli]EEQ7294246.1 restriction endonuclease subunit S [Escherichia coli]EEZ1648826.1 restriction endonuclease subunit S [Escherichia coli]EFC7258894.1 restriction endonuclease subunit S [Escherichia coli]
MSKLTKYKFSDLYSMASGISSTKEQAGHGSPFLSFSVVFNNYFVPDILNDLMDTSEKEKETYSIKTGDIFLTRTSEVIDELAMSCVAVKDYPNATFSGFLKRLRPTQDHITYPKFMAFYLRNPMFRKTITNNAVMTLRASLNEAIFSYLELLLPTYSEQKKAGDLLYLLNQKIALNNRINAELEAMAKTLYDYWFVQFDFPDANGKPYKTSGGRMEYNATLKREIPAGWVVNTLSQIANITMGQSPAGESYNEDGIGTLFFQGSTDFGWLFPTPRQYTTSPTRMAKKCDILLSVRAPVGDMNIANADCCIGRGLAALNSKSRSDGFLFYVMKYFKQVFERRNAEGTTFGSMTKDDLHSLQVVCPEPGLLKRYDDIVSEYNKMIFTRSLENQELIKLRDWLLPILMNGQVKIK